MVESKQAVQQFADACIRCGICAQTDCGNFSQGTPCLGDICESWLNGEETYFSFPFTCALCNRCTVNCPVDLKANAATKPLRAIGQSKYPQLRENYRHFRTDLKYNLFSLLISKRGGNPADVVLIEGDTGISDEADATAFFPGCSLNAYAPELTDLTFDWLKSEGIAARKLNFCCGATFFDTGFFDEFIEFRKGVVDFLAEQGIKRVVICCPHCAHILPETFEGADIELVRLTDLLLERDVVCFDEFKYSIHDACYDREEGLFGDAVRKLFASCEEVPLPHDRKDTICCGGGGMVSAYARDFCEYRRNMRLAEIDSVDTDVILSTCFSCVNSMQRGESSVPVKHYLELLFGYDVDWNQVYSSVDEMYADTLCRSLLNTTDTLF